MPRIPESELSRLKAEVSLQRLAEARGVKLIRKGADLHGRCPWHDDRTPSLVITPEKNVWNCLGACQTGGSVVDWVMKAEGVSFRHAVELLRAGPSELAPEGVAAPRAPAKRKLPALASPDVDDQILLRRVVDFYHQSLLENPEAQAYLKSRELFDRELVARFKLGYVDRSLSYRLPLKVKKEGRAIRERLQAAGILRESGHEHFRGSLVVPLLDAGGRLVQMYGRKVGKRLRKGTAMHLYLPGPQRGVWNREALAASKEVILCESLLDAMTFWVHGIRNVTTTYGTSGLTPDHWDAFKKAGTERVLIAYDRDAAGEKAAAKLAEELNGAGLAAYRVQFPKGMDANEYASKVQPAAKSLAVVVRHAVWLGEGKEPTREVSLNLTATVAAEEESPKQATKGEGWGGSPASEEEPPTESVPPPVFPPLDASSLPPPASPPTPPGPTRIPEALRAPGLTRRGEEYLLTLGDRDYRVRGLAKNLAYDVMKVNVLVRRERGAAPQPGAGFHVDTLDLYVARQRQHFAKLAAAELGLEEATMKKDLGGLLLALEAVQDEEIQRKLEPVETAVVLTESEEAEAMDLLRSPDLLRRILNDFDACGVVGEEVNKLVGYLAATSRKLDRPLAVVVQSNSAAGKSSLMDAVLAFMPEEELSCFSAMTGQSLFYMSGADLKHKILAIAEEEGAQRASYALKLLQSEGQLTIASTGKDPTSGRLTTEEYKVEGPVMIFLTTTATDVDEELMNRCLVLTVDEGSVQTRAIHHRQRDRHLKKGRRASQDRDEILRRHRNAQRLLKPVVVVNPYADQLTFLDHRTRFRRDHMKYLSLIQTVTLLHQHQRPVRTYSEGEKSLEYIEVTPGDIAVANHLAHEVFGHSVDELPPQTRTFLHSLVAMVLAACEKRSLPRDEVRFTRREVREWTGLKNSQVHVHLTRLDEMEYVLIHAGRRGKSIVYELLYDGPPDAERPHFPGLVDVKNLRTPPGKSRGYDANLPDPFRCLSGPFPGCFRSGVGDPVSPSSGSSSLSLIEEKEASKKNAAPGAGKSAGYVVPTNGTKPPVAS